MNVLVLNSGCSSLKFQQFATDLGRIAQNDDERLCRGQMERIGGEVIVEVQTHGGQRQKITASLPDMSASLEYLARWTASEAAGITEVRSLADIHAVGHRVVHQGELFAELPWRRNTQAGQCPSGPGRAQSVEYLGKRFALHKWALHSGIGLSVARDRTDSQQQIFHVRHGQPQCIGL